MPNSVRNNTAGLHAIRKSPARVTPRQAEILDLVTLDRRDIALVLNISENTVKTHLKRAYEILGVENRAQAAVRWIERKAA